VGAQHQALSSASLARLGELLGVRGEELRVESLSGGVSNRSFRVAAGGQSWVARFSWDLPAHHRIDAAAEREVLECVAAAGLTPRVIASDPDEGILVTRYLNGAQAWSAESAREPRNIRRAAARLRALHALDCQAEPFLPTAVAAGYLEGCGGRVALREEEVAWADELERLARAFGSRFAATALCHNDLIAPNILDDGELWFVDFEYAARSHPVVDLASLAGMNCYGAPAQALLVEAYYGERPVPFSQAQFGDAVRMLQSLSYFWAKSRLRVRDTDVLASFADRMAAVLR